MTKTTKFDDIIMIVLMMLIIPVAFFGGMVFCIFVTMGMIAGIIATAISAFIIGLMFGIELIDVLR